MSLLIVWGVQLNQRGNKFIRQFQIDEYHLWVKSFWWIYFSFSYYLEEVFSPSLNLYSNYHHCSMEMLIVIISWQELLLYPIHIIYKWLLFPIKKEKEKGKEKGKEKNVINIIYSFDEAIYKRGYALEICKLKPQLFHGHQHCTPSMKPFRSFLIRREKESISGGSGY